MAAADIVDTELKRPRQMSYNFRDLARQEAINGNLLDIESLMASCSAEKKETFTKNLNGFKQLFVRFLDEEKGIDWKKISPPPADMIKLYASLPSFSSADVKLMLDKLVVLKLNGGLGTTMGCTGPKSVVTVRDEFTFLDMQVQQIEGLNKTYGCNVPLVLMNSFSTHDDTQKVLRKYANLNVRICAFNQSQYPRIFKESLRMVAKSVDADVESWYPPGHGDMYQAFYNSGLLEKFLEEGKEFIFCSNIDNLGATVDISILNYLMNSNNEKNDFIMEVTDKTRADIKGGTLIMYEDKLRLLEIAQVPKDYVQEFKSIKTFKIFNTNNLWVKMSSIKAVVEKNGPHMEIIPNYKRLDSGEMVIQLETAIGAAIKSFDRSIGINVPRSRFLPVKNCSDLLLMMSNLYTMEWGTLKMSALRQFPQAPLVQLGPHFQKVKDFLGRFANIPNIMELDHLTVSGDVTFGANVTLKGTVIIIANHGERIDIPSGSVLENKIVSGNLRILEH